MESPKNFQPPQKPAADPAVQGGNVVVPGTVLSGDIGNPKGNIAKPDGDKDATGNSVAKPATGAVVTPKSEPARK